MVRPYKGKVDAYTRKESEGLTLAELSQGLMFQKHEE